MYEPSSIKGIEQDEKEKREKNVFVESRKKTFHTIIILIFASSRTPRTATAVEKKPNRNNKKSKVSQLWRKIFFPHRIRHKDDCCQYFNKIFQADIALAMPPTSSEPFFPSIHSSFVAFTKKKKDFFFGAGEVVLEVFN